MNFKKAKWILLGLALSVSFLTGCSGEKTTKKKQVVIATGGSAGTYYAVGAGIANVINKYSTNLNAVAQGTNGAIENIRLVNSGDADIGITNWDALYFGYNGEGPFQGKKQNIVGLMTMYLSAAQMAVLDKSNIKSFEDLKGKKVNIGPPGSVATEMTKMILKEYGIDPAKDIQALNLSYDEGGNKLGDGDIDATLYLAGIPTAGLISLSNSNKINLLSVDDTIMGKLLKEYPYYDKITIPAGTYKNVDKDTLALQSWTSLVVNPKMSEEVANEIVSILLKHKEELLQVHSVMGDLAEENAKRLPIPFNPGAQKYFDKK